MPTDKFESINYPVKIFGDVTRTKHIGIDIGGSLAKIAYLVEDKKNKFDDEHDNKLQNDIYKTRYHMRFIKFETKYIESCLDFIQKHLLNSHQLLQSNLLHATGGGSVKYKDLIKNKLGFEMQKEDEIECLIRGAVFLLKNVKDESFAFDNERFPSFIYQNFSVDTAFPFILVNIGSGVSIIKVESVEKYERVGGTPIGGGTFWGLGSLLTNANDFDSLFQLAAEGCSENVDMLVSDIYGGAYELLNLPKSLIASSFGKCVRSFFDDQIYDKKHFLQADRARSLLKMICYNIGQLAVLYAQLNGINKIYFGGSFIRNNILPVLTISQSTELSALFFKHDGFLGAVGAFQSGIKINKIENDIKKDNSCSGIFEENIATSSFSTYSIKILSLDLESNLTTPFPLLINDGNIPIDRNFLIEYADYIEKWVPLFVREFKKYYISEINKCDKLCQNFIMMIQKRLDCYRSSDPLKLSNYLSDIFTFQDRFIKEFLIFDPLLTYKHSENLQAIQEFKDFIINVDSFNDISLRHSFIFDHLFAGNLVDFGSSDVLINSYSLSQNTRLNIIRKSCRYFFEGTFKKWINYFESKKWKKILIFVDNSGYELIFGIFGLIREFLKINSEIVLAANTYPSLNDVVCSELSLITNRIRCICPIINSYCESSIKFVQTGFGSSFLNLQRTHNDLIEASLNVDLVIIVGHSRSLIGFYDAKFNCDVLYIGTVNSKPLANKCDFQVFDTFMKFDFNNAS